MYKTLSIGEVLWDIFPEYKKPGGSPANVAFHLHTLGSESLLLSRIGNDQKGDELYQFLKEKGISVKHIQKDDTYPSGVVNIEFINSEPSYTIQEPSAWDFITITDELRDDIYSLDAVCFASLAQRNKVSSNTVQKLLTAVPENCLRVFDLNLRPPFINKEQIQASIEQSDVIKINEHEYKTLANWYFDDSFAEKIVENNPNKTILLTEGENGSSMFTSDGFFHEKAHPISGEGDFVGVGDAFLACFIYLKLSEVSSDKILMQANRYASYVASKKGAMPDIPASLIEDIQTA